MTADEVFEVIVKNVRVVIPELAGHAFAPTDSLKDLGANSIDRSEIVVMTLEDLAVVVPLVEVAGARNLGHLAALLHAKAGSR
ncbi:MAG: acyl carrier protein [Vicinamibacterales bacterium]